MNILIVEDDLRLAKMIKASLEKKDHEVCCVQNGRRALDTMEHDTFDGVISDIRMPGGNGIELLQASWRTFDIPPPFYVHSSEDIFYWAGRSWNLPEVIASSFKDFAIFRSKKIDDMFGEIQKWIDSIKIT